MLDWPPHDAAPTLAVAYERWTDKEMVGQDLRALLFRGYEVQQSCLLTFSEADARWMLADGVG